MEEPRQLIHFSVLFVSSWSDALRSYFAGR